MSSEVWIIDDDNSIRWVLEKAFERAAIACRSFASADAALEALAQQEPAVLLCDIRMPGTSGLELLQQLQQHQPKLPVIIMTAHSDLSSAVAAYRGGAFEYLPKPFDMNEVVAVTRRALAHRTEREQSGVDTATEKFAEELIGEAPAMQEVFRAIGRLSQSNITVLINGASGTGKELVARALHRHSPRRTGPFVALNMAAIPHELMDSELFGHEKGSFTGATGQRAGRFEQAHGGTLFLDEIGDMPMATQTRLLRVLAEGEFYRIGGHTPIKVDVRIIAATHQNLEELVANNRFREDLLHRLNVIRLHMPRLAERREDIPRLAAHFLQSVAKELKVEPKVLTPAAEDYLCRLPWPGNVRQLENTCRWLTVMAPGRTVDVDDLPRELQQERADSEHSPDWEALLRRWADRALASGAQSIHTAAVPIFERCLIEAALERSAGRKGDAAQLLGWGRNTLTRKLKELQLDTD